MEKMNCYDFSMKFAFVKGIEYRLVTNDLATGEETVEYINTDDADYSTKEYAVVMVDAKKKGTFVVYGYREINAVPTEDEEETEENPDKFHDVETGEILTERELWTEYNQSEERHEMTFGQYVNNCLTVNGGTLERI